MRYIFTLISVAFICISLSGLFSVVSATDDITKSTYTIELSQLDPFNGGHSNGALTGWDSPSGISSATSLLQTIAGMLLFIIPLIAAVSLVIAGYYYILSGGDSEKTTQAKTIIKWNLIAITVALLSYAIINIIAYIIGGGI